MDRHKTRVEMEKVFSLKELKLFFPILYDPDNPYYRLMHPNGKTQEETETPPAPSVEEWRHTPVLRICPECRCQNFAVFEDSKQICEWCNQEFP